METAPFKELGERIERRCWDEVKFTPKVPRDTSGRFDVRGWLDEIHEKGWYERWRPSMTDEERAVIEAADAYAKGIEPALSEPGQALCAAVRRLRESRKPKRFVNGTWGVMDNETAHGYEVPAGAARASLVALLNELHDKAKQ